MSKLEPKPNWENPNHSWDHLNHLLQANFKMHGNRTSVVIDLNDYSISKEEIITEAEKQGYTVTEASKNQLRFK